jgi:DENN (AEX-3) domain
MYEVHKVLLKKLGSLLCDRITGNSNEKYTVEFYLSVIFHHLFLSLDDSVGVIISSNKIPFINYRNGMNAPMSIQNISYGLLLQKISINNLIELIKLMLLERKLIVVSDNYGDIGHIIECILCLMQPIL